MKRILSVVLLMALFLCGCDRSMNWVISNEPVVQGVVVEIGEEFVTLRVTKADWQALEKDALVRVARSTRLNDCKFSAREGDEVAAYYDCDEGNWRAGAVPEIYAVHGYCLITSAGREAEE